MRCGEFTPQDFQHMPDHDGIGHFPGRLIFDASFVVQDR
jgi:hypothetical protein